MDQQIEDQIRARAQALWEAEGRPEGRELAHWEQAARELAAEETTRPAAPSEHGEIVAPTPPQGR